MDLSSGTRLGRYEIRSRLGAGGMGEVFVAYDGELEREVAIKVIREDAEESSERSRRFLQEAKAASALNHPNVAHVYEIGSQLRAADRRPEADDSRATTTKTHL